MTLKGSDKLLAEIVDFDELQKNAERDGAEEFSAEEDERAEALADVVAGEDPDVDD